MYDIIFVRFLYNFDVRYYINTILKMEQEENTCHASTNDYLACFSKFKWNTISILYYCIGSKIRVTCRQDSLCLCSALLYFKHFISWFWNDSFLVRMYRFSSAVNVFNYSFNFRALLMVEDWSTALYKLAHGHDARPFNRSDYLLFVSSIDDIFDHSSAAHVASTTRSA